MRIHSAFNGAFTEEEIKRVVRRLVTGGQLGVRTRLGRTNSQQPYLEIELWEIKEEERAASTPNGRRAGAAREAG